MTLFGLLTWAVFGAIVGAVARAILPARLPAGWLHTLRGVLEFLDQEFGYR